MIEVWFDGVCEPVNSGGHGAYGLYIKRNGKNILSLGTYVGHGKNISNNVAEYSGFLTALSCLKALKAYDEPITIKGDSKLVIEQMSGNWRIKQGLYVKLALKSLESLKAFTRIEMFWIPREENGICDKLAKDVLRKMGVKFRIQPE